MTLSSWHDLNIEAGKPKDWVYDSYIPWLKDVYPGEYERVEDQFKYKKELAIVKGKIPAMEELLKRDISPEMIMEIYKKELETQVHKSIGDKVKLMLASMEDDLVTARGITLQACILAIT